MDDSHWRLICLFFFIIFCLPLLVFGIRNLIIDKRLSNKKLTGKTNAYLGSYEHKKNALSGRKVVPDLTSLNYTYTVDGKKYKLGFRTESKVSSSILQRTIKIVYLRSNPKYAYCEPTRYNYAVSGWFLLIAGIVLSVTLLVNYICSL